MSALAARSAPALRAAIVGAGGISEAHAAGYLAAGVPIVAVCDVVSELAAAKALKWGVERVYTDYRAMLAEGGFEVVSVAAPTAVHHPATLAAAAAGKHVLVEKPIALDIAEADAMIAACADNHVHLCVNHQLRSNGAAQQAKRLLDSGALGRLTHVRLRQGHDWGGVGVTKSFTTKASAGGGTLLDNGCHLADLALYFGGPVAEVFGRIATLRYDIEVEDTAHLSMLYESGAMGVIETSWSATGWEEGFWLYGTEGALEFTNRYGTPRLRHSFRASPGLAWDQTDVAETVYAGAVNHTRHVLAWLAAVKGEGPVPCRGEDGREAVRLILSAYASAERGVPVPVAGAPAAPA